MKGTALVCLFLSGLTSGILASKCENLKEKAYGVRCLQLVFGCRVSEEPTTTVSTTAVATTAGNPCIPNPCQGDSTCDVIPDSELGFKCNCDGVRTGNLCELCSSCFTSSDCNDFGGVQVEAECQEGEVCCQF